MKTMSTSINVIIVVMMQLMLLLLSNNVSVVQGWFFDFGPIFGFPPATQPPSYSPPTAPKTPPPSSTPPAFRPAVLKAGFYQGLCPDKSVDIEAIIKAKVQEEFPKDPTILPAFLRMQFHDCFVQGCDASILIDGPSSEKKADANPSVRGYELIDALKALAEAQCPGLVSCADLIAIVTTEVLGLGGGPTYAVQTGRCDGLRSNVNDVDLPAPSISAQQSIQVFGAKKFTPEEMVVLLGCHTVGVSHCQFFQDRLYPDNDQFDSNMDSSLRKDLISKCPSSRTSNDSTFLDQNPTSSNTVDNSFYDQLIKQRGVLPIDQALSRDPATSGFVTNLAQNPTLFNPKLASAMLKLQAFKVLTGNQGEIRKNCRRFN